MQPARMGSKPWARVSDGTILIQDQRTDRSKATVDCLISRLSGSLAPSSCNGRGMRATWDVSIGAYCSHSRTQLDFSPTWRGIYPLDFNHKVRRSTLTTCNPSVSPELPRGAQDCYTKKP